MFLLFMCSYLCIVAFLLLLCNIYINIGRSEFQLIKQENCFHIFHHFVRDEMKPVIENWKRFSHIVNIMAAGDLGHLLTWINFNNSMDK